MNKKNIGVLFCAIFVFTFVACNSTPEVVKTEELPLDYTQKDVHDNEIKQIEALLSTKPVKALWRATILNDEVELNKCASYVASLCEGYLKDEDYFTAYAIYKSLKAAGFSKLVTSMTEKQIEAKYYSGVPGINTKQTSKLNANQKDSVNTFISGTVTVWVDLGIKVQRGMGTAERVIGSGFFIDERGYIITNHHVIAELVNPKYEGYGRLYIKLSEIGRASCRERV